MFDIESARVSVELTVVTVDSFTKANSEMLESPSSLLIFGDGGTGSLPDRDRDSSFASVMRRLSHALPFSTVGRASGRHQAPSATKSAAVPQVLALVRLVLTECLLLNTPVGRLEPIGETRFESDGRSTGAQRSKNEAASPFGFPFEPERTRPCPLR